MAPQYEVQTFDEWSGVWVVHTKWATRERARRTYEKVRTFRPGAGVRVVETRSEVIYG